MTPRQGPTKKLAPTLRDNSICPHDYIDSEELQLEIDCSKCNGAHDLYNNQCMSAIVNVLAAGAQPDTIVLKRFMHKRYRGDSVRTAARAAAVLAALNRAIASMERPSDRRCRTCPASADQLLHAIRRSLIDDPAAYVSAPSKALSGLRSCLPRVECDRSGACFEAASKAAEAHGASNA